MSKLKKCNKCNLPKSLNSFYKNKNTKDGFNYYCKECILEYKKSNPTPKEKITEYNKRHWRKKYGDFEYKGKEHRKEYMRHYMKEYNKKYPHILRSKRLLNDVLRRMGKTKTSPTSTLLGYSAIDLKNHLEALGMDWDKHQINHMIPVSWFHIDTPINIINDLRNLQPATMQENLAQSNNYCILPCREYIEIAKKYLIWH